LAIQGLVTNGWIVVVGTGPDGLLGRISQTARNNVWSAWEILGPAVSGAPTVTHSLDGRLEIFAAGPEGLLGHVWQTEVDGAWSAWDTFGTPISGDPVVFHNADGHLEVFARGEGGVLGHTWQIPEHGWSAWEDLGPVISGRPAVFQNRDGHLEVVARGPEGVLGHMWQLGTSGQVGWSAWEDLGPAVSGDPAMFLNTNGHLEVFARGPEGVLGHTWQTPEHGWSAWEDLGPAISGDPAVFQNADGHLEVFARGPEGLLGHTWQTPGYGWSAWTDLGPPISGDPAVFQNADGRLEVFAIGPEGVLGHMWQPRANGEAGWSSWEDLGPAGLGRRLAVGQSGTSRSDDVEQERPERGSRTPKGLSADVLVIGAGPAGITVADGLVRAGARVVLAESGGLDDDPVAQELNDGLADGPIIKYHATYLRDGRRRQVQGSASRWGPGWCMPFRANDFDVRSWVAHSGWPISQTDLRPYETMAAETFGFEAFDAPRPDGRLVRLSYRFPPNPQVFRSMYLYLLAKPHFRPELGATAVELKVRGDRIESVRFALPDGGELRVAADTVVLAAGGIENARLLLLHEDSIATSGMTGRCFMEHPHVLAGTVKLPDEPELRPCFAPGPEELEVLGLGDAIQADERLLNASVQLRPRHGVTHRAGQIECDLYVRAEQAPNPESRVVLGERLDRLGYPQPVLHWRVLRQDWETVVRTAALVASALEERYGAVSRLSIREDKPWPWEPAGPAESGNATWGNHHLGTTRMADDPAQGVVDRDCLLRGTANLYVAGSSVFPTGACANPTFTIVALAHRLVDHLGARR
jgi:choline dehydrogenase-like flavoprotein